MALFPEKWPPFKIFETKPEQLRAVLFEYSRQIKTSALQRMNVNKVHTAAVRHLIKQREFMPCNQITLI
jgi:hypothetical protein